LENMTDLTKQMLLHAGYKGTDFQGGA